MWEIQEKSLIACLNWAMATGELPINAGSLWKIKKAETDQEKEVSEEFVLIDEDNGQIHAAPCLIELGIRADCIEDQGEDNTKYKIVP